MGQDRDEHVEILYQALHRSSRRHAPDNQRVLRDKCRHGQKIREHRGGATIEPNNKRTTARRRVSHLPVGQHAQLEYQRFRAAVHPPKRR